LLRRQLTQTVVVMTTTTQSTVAETVAMTTGDEDELRGNMYESVFAKQIDSIYTETDRQRENKQDQRQ